MISCNVKCIGSNQNFTKIKDWAARHGRHHAAREEVKKMKITTLTNFIVEQVNNQLATEDALGIVLKIGDLENEIKRVAPDLEIEDIDIEDFLMEYEED